MKTLVDRLIAILLRADFGVGENKNTGGLLRVVDDFASELFAFESAELNFYKQLEYSNSDNDIQAPPLMAVHVKYKRYMYFEILVSKCSWTVSRGDEKVSDKYTISLSSASMTVNDKETVRLFLD